MTPIQQLMLGVGASKKTYMDDVFSTDLWVGNGSARTITNNIDVSGEGGLVWVKNRGSGENHVLSDTVRGATKYIKSNHNGAEVTTSTSITAFTSSGYSIGTDDNIAQNDDGVGWTFRKAKGFFDVVTYTGNGSARTISHSLGSIPGLIMIKCTSAAENWIVYHREVGSGSYLILSNNAAAGTDSDGSVFNNGSPTSTTFSVGTHAVTNSNGETYVAYLFAGGESTAATARSVGFDGSDDYLAFGDSSDLSPESGDFTWEAWIKPDSWTGNNWDVVYANHVTNGLFIGKDNSENFVVRSYGNTSYIETSNLPPLGQWTHVAATRSGSTFRLFYNGTLEKSGTTSDSFATGDTRAGMGVSSDTYDGLISNLRFVKGTALYTSSFKPPTEPLTNITNTKLLCCNNSSITGSTVAPATITSGDSPTASTDSPFDDPAAFKFGENGDQNIIKCGSFIGNQSNGNPVELGWEPQWLLLKNADQNESWAIVDTTRGWIRGTTGNEADDAYVKADAATAENDFIFGYPTPTGFSITGSASWNWSDKTYIYVAIRRPDGYVGKPAEAGTDVFAMAYGNSGGTNPSYVSNFPVDFALVRQPATSEAWYVSSRLNQGRYLYTNTTNSEGDASSNFLFDHNNGWRDGSAATTYLSWMWKRHAGFDVVTYKGNGTAGRVVPHSLSKTPEMMWFKNRSDTEGWAVYHKGLNGGTNPEQYYLVLDTDAAEADWDGPFNDTAPSSTTLTVGSSNRVNGNSDNMIAMLFASVDGISKVGSWVGSNSAQTITLGFEPRFLLLKNVDTTNWWEIRDTARGWATSSGGTSQALYPNENNAQSSDTTIHKTSTGFVMAGNIAGINQSGSDYIYYAHA